MSYSPVRSQNHLRMKKKIMSETTKAPKNAPSQSTVKPTAANLAMQEISGEVLVPIIGGDFTLPFVQSLEFDGAYRRVKHSIAGSEDGPENLPSWAISCLELGHLSDVELREKIGEAIAKAGMAA